MLHLVFAALYAFEHNNQVLLYSAAISDENVTEAVVYTPAGNIIVMVMNLILALLTAQIMTVGTLNHFRPGEPAAVGAAPRATQVAVDAARGSRAASRGRRGEAPAVKVAVEVLLDLRGLQPCEGAGVVRRHRAVPPPAQPRLGVYPIVTSQHSSTTSYQIS